MEKKWKTVDPVVCTSETYKPRLGLASCLVGSPKTRKNTKLLTSNSNGSASQSESTSDNNTHGKNEEKNTNDKSNKIQEIRFDEEDAYLEKITKNDTINNIALFGGADFYGIYNDLYLMKI